MGSDSRAYTYIDRGTAKVANRWFERTWSTFLGNTTGLVQVEGAFEWLVGRCGEFEVVVDDRSLGVLDFGETAWAEENDAFGATLVGVQTCPGLEFTFRTMAYHDHPAMLRSAVIRNAGLGPVTVNRVTAEVLPVRHPGAEACVCSFSQVASPVEDGLPPMETAAIMMADRGLMLVVEPGATFQLFSPREDHCAVTVCGPQELDPGAWWALPGMFLAPFVGPLAAAEPVYADLRRRVRAQKQAEEDRDG